MNTDPLLVDLLEHRLQLQIVNGKNWMNPLLVWTVLFQLYAKYHDVLKQNHLRHRITSVPGLTNTNRRRNQDRVKGTLRRLWHGSANMSLLRWSKSPTGPEQKRLWQEAAERSVPNTAAHSSSCAPGEEHRHTPTVTCTLCCLNTGFKSGWTETEHHINALNHNLISSYGAEQLSRC